jgi:hypothetical protein
MGFHKKSGLTAGAVIALFLLKVAAGCINLFVHYHEYISNDIQFYYQQSLLDLHHFEGRPLAFVRDLFFNWGDFHTGYNLFSKETMPYWSDIGVLIHSKFMNLANIYSGKHLYTNVIFYNLIYFSGMMALYKTFYHRQPEKKYLFVAATFFIPSALFWCSGIHKDGWVLAAIGFALWNTSRYLETKKVSNLIKTMLALFLLFVSRYFVFLCFMPAYLLWILLRENRYRLLYFVILIGGFLGLLFLGNRWIPGFYPLEIIIAKQQAFFQEKGYSDMHTPILEPNLMSFIHNFPTACNHIFLRPYFSLQSPWKYNLAFVDAWTILLALAVSLFYLQKEQVKQIFYLSMLMFVCSMYLFIGYTTPNCGALVRYKSEFSAILLLVMFSLSNIPLPKRFRMPT